MIWIKTGKLRSRHCPRLNDGAYKAMLERLIHETMSGILTARTPFPFDRDYSFIMELEAHLNTRTFVTNQLDGFSGT